MKDFENQLFGAWVALGLAAQRNKQGVVHFACPACLGLFEIASETALCGHCKWKAEGKPEEIARQAAEKKGIKSQVVTLAELMETAPMRKGDRAVEFEQELYGAWRMQGLVAAPSKLTGRLAFSCPACDKGKLLVDDRTVTCDDCDFRASGESWEIAATGKAAAIGAVVAGGEGGEHENNAALFAALDARRIRVEDRPEKPVEVVRLVEQAICTPGNITAISAQAKAGKSAALGGLLAAMFAQRGPDESPWDAADCLGFECALAGGKAVVWFDTEQSPFDSWRNLERAAKRAGLDNFPSSLPAYRLLDVATPQRRLLLTAEMERAAAECGGVHAVIVDGIGDLCVSVNDEAEAVGLVDELARLAVTYACPVLVVIHENPGSRNEGKTRGHLGSQLERKAESNLRLVKGGDGVTQIFSERCRSASIPQGRGVFFEWSDQAGMHVKVERVTVDKAEAKRAEAVEELKEVFRGAVGALRFVDLKTRIHEALGVSLPTAARRITGWSKMGIIKRMGDGWARVSNVDHIP